MKSVIYPFSLNACRFFCTILFISNASTLWSQDYLPLVVEDSHYVYEKKYGSEENCSGYWTQQAYVLSIGGDTSIQNTVYKKVTFSNLKLTGTMGGILRPYTILDSYLFGYLREEADEKKVYFKPADLYPENTFCDTLEHLLFDFSLQVGDTLNTCVKNQIGYFNTPVVDSISTIQHYGELKKALNTTGVFTYCGLLYEGEGRIIEGFGYEHYGIFNEMQPKSLIFYCRGPFDACGIISSTVEVPKKTSIRLSPNPAYSTISIQVGSTIPLRDNRLRVMSIDGQLMYSGQAGKNRDLTLDISGYRPGVYMVSLGRYRTKFIKIE